MSHLRTLSFLAACAVAVPALAGAGRAMSAEELLREWNQARQEPGAQALREGPYEVHGAVAAVDQSTPKTPIVYLVAGPSKADRVALRFDRPLTVEKGARLAARCVFRGATLFQHPALESCTPER
jgi:hypothetical protein